MPKRTICIQNAARVSTKLNSLILETDQGKTSIPFEDIWVVILESHSIAITSACFAQMVDQGIGIMTCDATHHPNGLLLPIGAHSRHAYIVEQQLAISKPLQKQLWKRIVEAKIKNQSQVLRILSLTKEADALEDLKLHVLSDDADGREAVAASKYFKALIVNGNRRNSTYTAALDFGYGVLRAGIARTAVSNGWLVSRGIHHKSELNAFNLVDDLIEPFRPVVDLLVFSNAIQFPLTPHTKQMLVGLFEYEIAINNKIYSVQSAIEIYLENFKTAILENNSNLLLVPELLPLQIKTEVDR